MNRPTATPDLSLAAFKPALDQALDHLLSAAITSAQSIDTVYAELLQVTRDTLLSGGKRLRPYLAYLAYHGLNGDDPDAFIQAAASQELLHHFLLIHDDIMDRDLMRHGSPNVEGVYRERFIKQKFTPANALHYAESFALMAGDAACMLGLQAVTNAQFDPQLKLKALQCIQQMLFEIMGGQLMDVDNSLTNRPASPERLLAICHYKTATYSCQTPLQFGAILAGAPATVHEPLRRFGHSLGIAFQLTDDLLGVYGDQSRLGKPVLSDLHEGKQTLLMYYAHELATPTQARTLRRLWGNPRATIDDLNTVRHLLRTCGAQIKTAQLAATHLQDSLAALATTALSAPVQTELTRLAHFCVDRTY